jgi:hypothetical protein
MGPKDGRGWKFACSSQKGYQGLLVLPPDQSGYREERDGLHANRHLNDLAESIIMNVGGLLVEVSSPPMKQASVGGSIVGAPRGARLEWMENPVAHIRWATTLWDVAPVGDSTGVKQLSLKGNREVRGRPPRCGAWVRHGMARPNEVDFNLR